MQMSGVFVLNNNAVMNASLRAETGVTVQSCCRAYIYARRITRAVASEGDNSRGGAKGDAQGRVQEGGTPPAQLGGMGERCELPHRGLGRSPRSQRFLRLKNSKNYTKTWRPRKRPRPLFYMYKYVY